MARTKSQRKARRLARRERKRQARKVGVGASAPRRNPKEKGSLIPWAVALGGALVAGYGAYRAFNPAAPAPPPGAPPGMHGGYPPPGYPPNYQDRFAQQRAYYEQQARALAGQQGQVGSVDEHGIPNIALPPESAHRTMQAMRYQQQAQAQGLIPLSQQAAARAAAQGGQGGAPQLPQGIPVESFGGEGGNLGGENF